MNGVLRLLSAVSLRVLILCVLILPLSFWLMIGVGYQAGGGRTHLWLIYHGRFVSGKVESEIVKGYTLFPIFFPAKRFEAEFTRHILSWQLKPSRFNIELRSRVHAVGVSLWPIPAIAVILPGLSYLRWRRRLGILQQDVCMLADAAVLDLQKELEIELPVISSYPAWRDLLLGCTWIAYVSGSWAYLLISKYQSIGGLIMRSIAAVGVFAIVLRLAVPRMLRLFSRRWVSQQIVVSANDLIVDDGRGLRWIPREMIHHVGLRHEYSPFLFRDTASLVIAGSRVTNFANLFHGYPIEQLMPIVQSLNRRLRPRERTPSDRKFSRMEEIHIRNPSGKSFRVAAKAM